jgi:hypothetical protein
VIRYTLACDRGHDFESWFRDSDTFEAQRDRKLVGCPVCGSVKVDRAIMAPQVARKDRLAERAPALPAQQAPSSKGLPSPATTTSGAAAAPPAPAQPVAMLPPEAQELRAKIKALRDELTRNAEDVGDKFSEVARQIHYGEIDEKPIYGEATLADAKALAEEGVVFHPLPVLPDEHN